MRHEAVALPSLASIPVKEVRLFSQSAMGNPTKKVELVANIAIIAVTLLLGGILVKNQFFPSRVVHDLRVPPGTKLSLAGVDWEANGRTVLLVMAKGCDFCSESAPFYRRLAQEAAERKTFRLVAVLPQSVQEAEEYLKSMDVKVDQVRQAAMEAIRVRATPTIVLIDNAGTVTDCWVGKLKQGGESEVLARLSGQP